MHIGLVGGIGPAATDLYYRGLIKRAAAAGRDLDLTIVHADTPTLLANQSAGNHDAQCAIYGRLADRLVKAGAECMAITSIAGHFCIDAFAEISPLPLIDMMSVLRADLVKRGHKTVGVMGTKTVMATGMYGKLGETQVVAPLANSLDQVHGAYTTLATTARSTPDLQKLFFDAGRALVEGQGAEAVLLGGTDLNLAFEGVDCGFPIIDCADLHIEAIAAKI